ncbi:MAG: YidC/Oxa1 family membrane protein insertase [Dehalococcoidia bacterium]|jgi:YidC/Oxa1 family membrane protein insertase|nr:MAG: YidC/Oxa1 family membrane protein insertase [Chloroflexota bacterium]|tara:strand:+ start:1614 stop:2564 length:951 start_codon:yes stop_codon:yes gene_type:complete
MPIGSAWRFLIEDPLLNILVSLSHLLFDSYGLSILAFTLITRVITFPLTKKTLSSMKNLQTIQPQIQELQKKYSDPKRRSQETMKLYKEAGVNPLGCLGPQLIQLPIFIGLYQVIRLTSSQELEKLKELTERLYNYQYLTDAIPLSNTFLSMDLGANGKWYLALLVFISAYMQQKLSSSSNQTNQNEQQKQMNKMLQWLMPVFFGYIIFSVPAGLGIYWAASTVMGIILHIMFIGLPEDKLQLIPFVGILMNQKTTHSSNNKTKSSVLEKNIDSDENASKERKKNNEPSRGKRKNSRGSNSTSSKKTGSSKKRRRS